jgi:hypothetical protein
LLGTPALYISALRSMNSANTLQTTPTQNERKKMDALPWQPAGTRRRRTARTSPRSGR